MHTGKCRDAYRDREPTVSFEVGGGVNVPSNLGACAHRKFTYLVRGPWRVVEQYDSNCRNSLGIIGWLMPWHMTVLLQSCQWSVNSSFRENPYWMEERQRVVWMWYVQTTRRIFVIWNTSMYFFVTRWHLIVDFYCKTYHIRWKNRWYSANIHI